MSTSAEFTPAHRTKNGDILWFFIALPLFAVVGLVVAFLWCIEVAHQQWRQFMVWAGWRNPPEPESPLFPDDYRVGR